MARPKSEDRRAALLDAATRVFAESGLGAPTSRISAEAKVSEGSFFTYFKTKDDLVNELYRDLRLQVADAVMANFPRRAGVRERLEHVWNGYVTWGIENPIAKRTLKLVSNAHVITPEVRAEGSDLFAEVARIEQDALDQRKAQHLPPKMASYALKYLAEMTMELVSREPAKLAEYRAAGFQMLWAALSAKP